MPKIGIEALEKYFERVRQTQRAKGKQVVLGIDEAHEISVIIAQMLLREAVLLSEMVELQKANNVVEVQVGGGSFSKK